ncbi:3-oxoacyl-[acyl-carrier-protein] synthase-1 [Alteromonadaceae bacterium Bs31]|nr:3-oxoacyl-[acyl-carrier-protein] synthase-1 [Alteromonadaceae bacterium Bs31]
MNNTPLQLSLVASGMLTPLGESSAMTAASTLAGITAAQEYSLLNAQFKPFKLALVPDEALPPLQQELSHSAFLCQRQKRMLRLAHHALEQLKSSAQQANVALEGNTPLFLALPEKLYPYQQYLGNGFLSHLHLQTALAMDTSNSRLSAVGRAGGIHVLDLAIKYLQSGLGSQVLVGGVDSYLDPALLAQLDLEKRLSAEASMDGFVAGEGAAFALLQAHDGSGPGRIHPPGFGNEPGHRYSDQPYLGTGLDQAFKSAIANGSGLEKIHRIYSSMNGEGFHSKEYGVACTRSSAIFSDNVELHHPAEFYGDLGAASAVAMLCLDHQRRLKKEQGNTLIYASAELGARAAVCIS